jgi:hypothetical protein
VSASYGVASFGRLVQRGAAVMNCGTDGVRTARAGILRDAARAGRGVSTHPLHCSKEFMVRHRPKGGRNGSRWAYEGRSAACGDDVL